MAKMITLQHTVTEEEKKAYIGFSWTSLFFGPLVPLFRGDFLVFFVLFVTYLIGNVLTLGVFGLIACAVQGFTYNQWHARRVFRANYRNVVGNGGMSPRTLDAYLYGA